MRGRRASQHIMNASQSNNRHWATGATANVAARQRGKIGVKGSLAWSLAAPDGRRGACTIGSQGYRRGIGACAVPEVGAWSVVKGRTKGLTTEMFDGETNK